MTDRYACARVTSSKCVADSTFAGELALVLDDYEFAVIHFNNGLHGWDYSEEACPLRRQETDGALHARLLWCPHDGEGIL